VGLKPDLRQQLSQPVGTLPADMRSFYSHFLAFSPDGKRLALVQNLARVRVWNLTNRQLDRDFGIGDIHQAGTNGGTLCWVGENYLLLAGTTLVDIEHYAPVWTYTDLAAIAGVYQGRLWSVESKFRGEPHMASAHTPSRAIREKWAKIPADGLLAVKPGMEISVDLPADNSSEEIRQQPVTSLTQRGMKVVPQSELRPVGSIRPGATKTINYQAFGARADFPVTLSERPHPFPFRTRQLSFQSRW
jgi:hypothetical protein